MKKQLQTILKKLGKVEKMLLVALLAASIALAAVNARGKGSAAEAQQIEGQIADAQRRVRAIQQEDLPALSARFQELKAQSFTFPKKAEAEAAVVNLWNWAETKNVRLVRTNYSTAETSSGEWRLPQHIYSIDAAGELPDLIAYLEAIENSPFGVIQTDNWTLSPAGRGLWGFTFTLTIWSEGQKRTGS